MADTPETPDTETPRTRTEANRSNAQKSTGPRTPEGKANSSRNALSHGLTSSQTLLLPTENPAEYQNFHSSLLAELTPIGAEESELAQTIIQTLWRLRRIPALEAALLAPSPDSSPAQAFLDQSRALSTLSMHEQRLARLLERTRASLTKLQSTRRARELEEMVRATELRNYLKDKNVPFNPAEFGFVFSIPEIDRYAHRCHLYSHAREHAIEEEYAIADRQARPRDPRSLAA
jgi:hypothetical protein